MRPISVTTYTPTTSVTVHTRNGDEYDVTGDLISWQTSKAITSGQPTGTFTVNLVARSDTAGSWADKIRPMDYVEIRASKTGAQTPLPIIMRGFVTSSEQALQFDVSGGPQRQVTLTGQDFGKILTNWQILYLWQIHAVQSLYAALGYGLSGNFGIDATDSTPTKFFGQSMSHIIEPAVARLQKINPAVPDLGLVVSIPERYQMPVVAVESYTGSYWNLLQTFASPPFGELFVFDDADGPKLVARMAPYHTLAGDYPPPGQPPMLEPAIIPAQDISAYDLERSDQDALSFFFTYSDAASLTGTSAASYVLPGGERNPVYYPATADLYGLRQEINDTPWVTMADVGNPYSGSQATAIAGELNSWLAAVMKDNPEFLSGTIDCHGDPDLIVGRYVQIVIARDKWTDMITENATRDMRQQ